MLRAFSTRIVCSRSRPTLCSTALRLYGVIGISCRWHGKFSEKQNV